MTTSTDFINPRSTSLLLVIHPCNSVYENGIVPKRMPKWKEKHRHKTLSRFLSTRWKDLKEYLKKERTNFPLKYSHLHQFHKHHNRQAQWDRKALGHQLLLTTGNVSMVFVQLLKCSICYRAGEECKFQSVATEGTGIFNHSKCLCHWKCEQTFQSKYRRSL